MSICCATTNNFMSSELQIPKKPSPRKSDSDNIINQNTSDVSPETEIERFEREFVKPLSKHVRSISFGENHAEPPLNLPPSPASQHSIPSSDGSVISDSNYDSGAFSRNSTPEPADKIQFRFQEEVEPLKSPPLVISMTNKLSNNKTGENNLDTIDGKLVLMCLSAAGQSSELKHQKECAEPDGVKSISASHLTWSAGTETLAKSKFHAKKQEPTMTITIGSSTRPCINDNDIQDDPLQSQSSLKLHDEGRIHVKMPHMGTSRLITPPKPPRMKLPTQTSERNRISTVILNRSNTSSSSPTHKYNSNTFQEDPSQEDLFHPIKSQSRHGRDGSFISDSNSCVYSVSSSATTSCGYQVTVNGQHHCPCQEEPLRGPHL